MNGIICVCKSKGFTSFDVVAVMRKLCGTRKIGHAGTLDPIAEGVLPLFIGNATKAVDFIPSDSKEYIAGFKLGITTDTEDITGTVLSQQEPLNPVSLEELENTLNSFRGEIKQVPPMYSAVSVDGKRLYELARKGITIERQARPVEIHDLIITEYDGNSMGLIKVACSRGTYIRTLIHDIGQKLGTGAVMTSLTRMKSGVFTLEDCFSLDELKDGVEKAGANHIEQHLIPLDKLFAEYPKIKLDAEQSRLFKNGVKLDADRLCFERKYNGVYTVYNSEMVLVAIAKVVEHTLLILQRFNTKSN